MRKQLIVIVKQCLSITVILALVLALKGEVMAELNPQTNTRDGIISQLLTILRDEQIQQTDPERLIQAIERLGRMKAVAAIEDLGKLITLKKTFSWEKENLDAIQEFSIVTVLSRYPAAGALFEIGKPALPVLIKVIESNDNDSLASDNAIYTIDAIFRENPSKAIKYIRENAARAASPEATLRLLNAATKIEQSHLQSHRQ